MKKEQNRQFNCLSMLSNTHFLSVALCTELIRQNVTMMISNLLIQLGAAGLSAAGLSAALHWKRSKVYF